MLKNTRLGIVCTHPTQYYTPVFKLLATEIHLMVFYTAGSAVNHDRGFGLNIEWDIPLLHGYNYHFLNNTAKNPGTHHFFGIITPDAIQTICDFNPDCLMIYGWASYSHFRILQHFKKKTKIFFRGDSTLLQKDRMIKHIIKKIGLNYLYSGIDHALYVGTNNKSYFKKFGFQRSQLHFIKHAVDNQRFALNTQNPCIRTQLQLNHNDLLILFTGKFIPLKNTELLLLAFQQLDLQNTKLLLVGDGPLSGQLKSNYQHKDIHFLPFQNQQMMPSIYQACDLFCMPSKRESWGLAVNEAMAAGKAVLVSDRVGSAIDLVKPANGLVFRNEDLQDLKRQLKTLCTSREQLNIMGQSSLSIISSWSFEVQTKKILDALSS
ncbi:MAG: glycosyltransferase family 4 protein [Bacteroidota bacterium]